MIDSLNRRLDTLKAGEAGKLGALMATAFIDMVGALMILPLMPFYAKSFGASDFLVTVLVSSFSAMQLLTAPVWGRVSDRYGRKPVLLIGLGASALAYVVFAFAHNYWVLLLSRIVQGAGGGTTGVIQAYVADSVAPKNRARALGWLSASTNAGVVLGPAIGSLASELRGWTPGILAASLCLLNIVFASKYLAESRGESARAKHAGSLTPLQAVRRVAWGNFSAPSTRLIWMYAVGIGAFYGVNVLLVLYLNRVFDVTVHTIGWFYSYIGILGIIFRIGVLGRTVDRLGERRTSRLGATSLALGLALVPFTSPLGIPGLSLLPLAIVVALIPLGAALNFPCVTALLSRVVGEHERGLYMGVQQTYGGLARVLYPLVAGSASDHFGIGAPFWLSGALVASTIVMGTGLERYSRRTGEHPIPPVVEGTGEEAVVAD
ncbi:MAG TPA: MFS transporter [Gemmatimonadaceae bacterium]|nr:MFS transporter [Gemmatimonadaceae bacterium]